MSLTSIPLNKLFPHPDNPNTMTEDTLTKLKRHIARTKRYEPLIVRPHPTEPDAYQLINGHHRKHILEKLKYTHADCIIWNVSDEETDLLLTTLNRLNGFDDPTVRAKLLKRISSAITDETMLKLIPEHKTQLARLLKTIEPIKQTPPPKPADMPEPMTIFLTHDQKQIIKKALTLARESLEEPSNQSQQLIHIAQSFLTFLT